MSVRIFHIADVHFDTPFSALTAEEAASCKNSLRSAFSKAVLAAKNRGVELFFIAGDLFDSRFVSPDTLEFVRDKIASFPSCRFFISPGNHDPYGEDSFYAKGFLPENAHVFRGKERVEIDELGVDVYGFGFTEGHCGENPITGYPERRQDRISILVCHGDLNGREDGYAPFTESDVAASGFDYIALGHIHKASGVMKQGGTYYAYPGCIEGRGFDETGDKGGLLGTVSKGSVELAHFSLSVRRYERIEVDISGAETRLQVMEAIRSALRPYGGTRLRLTLTGRPKNSFYISEELFETGGSCPEYIELRDETVPSPDFTAIEAENTLRGAFFRRMRERIEGAEEGSVEKELAVRALKAGLAALEGRELSEV
ncbi:MAG: DNA repair exonuclease [Clostridia bacterium]|nr:DNA repair exonuclease [Clostridia bacterium]